MLSWFTEKRTIALAIEKKEFLHKSLIKEFIRNNLVIDADYVDSWGPDPSMRVSLRFEDEHESFASTIVCIPYED